MLSNGTSYLKLREKECQPSKIDTMNDSDVRIELYKLKHENEKLQELLQVALHSVNRSQVYYWKSQYFMLLNEIRNANKGIKRLYNYKQKKKLSDAIREEEQRKDAESTSTYANSTCFEGNL